MDEAAKELTTKETVPSKTKEVIIKEAKRIEESTLYSAKGHFIAAQFWAGSRLWIGIPMSLLAAVAGASALAQFDHNRIVAGFSSIIVAALSGLLTFLNPNERASVHLNSGNSFDSLQNKARVFWTIDCWRGESEEVLTEKVKYLGEQKDKLNLTSPQVPRWAYKRAKQAIMAGEAEYAIDKSQNKIS